MVYERALCYLLAVWGLGPTGLFHANFLFRFLAVTAYPELTL